MQVSGSGALVVGGASGLGEATARRLHDDGASLVIHAKADDNMTDPSGNSGARIACAVLGPQVELR